MADEPTHIIFRCRRCQELLEVPSAEPGAALREAIEHGSGLRVHACADGAHGVAELIGDGPGRYPLQRHREAVANVPRVLSG